MRLEALRIIGETGFHQLPVVDDDGTFLGFVTREGVIDWLAHYREPQVQEVVTPAVKAALRWYLPLVVVAATLNLRPALLTLGLVLPAVQRSLALSPFGAGALTALPILALGLASAVAVPVGRRLGWSGGLVFALVLVGAGTLLRSAGSDVDALRRRAAARHRHRPRQRLRADARESALVRRASVSRWACTR